MPRTAPAHLRPLIALAATLLFGCASTQPAARVTVAGTSHEAWPGRVLVLPITLDGPLPTGGRLTARLEDGRSLDARLHWIGVTPSLPEDAGPARPGWIPSAGSWHATSAADPVRPPGAGGYFVTLSLPIDAIGQSVWIGRTRTPLSWRPDPRAVARDYEEREQTLPWVGDPPSDELDSGSLAALNADPLRRWRAKLLLNELDPPSEPFFPGLDGLSPRGARESDRSGEPFPDPALEALARQVENQWRSALTTLDRADPALAARVRTRLARTITVGGRAYPAWPDDQEARELLSQLRPDGRASLARIAQRAAAWLEAQPPAASWVIDDQGLRPGRPDAGPTDPLVSIGLAGLSDRPTLGWASGDPLMPTPEPVPLLPGGVLPLSAEPDRSGPEARAVAHAGIWVEPHAVIAAPQRVSPPGATCGPALLAWSRADWLDAAQAGGLPTPEWASSLLLYREPDGDAWRVYAELARPEPPGDGSAMPETLRVWFGPRGAPVAELIARDSGVTMSSTIEGRAAAEATRIATEPGRWLVSMPVPTEAIESGRFLRMGYTRTDRHGRHWAWPRRTTPWDTEPGRLLFDLGAWDPLDSATATATGAGEAR
ncbi:MAG: hypothetical protein AAGG07_00620 [Planctomycetota bacterium]